MSEPTPWTGYHEKQSRDKTGNILDINSSLLLIHYKSSSVKLQYHLMKVGVDYTKYLNPGQVVVGVSDVPLYALKRSIQMTYPEEFEGYFCFMGGLHIEQAALICIGQLIKGSGLDDIIDATSLNTVGVKTTVCDVNNSKKAIYTLQVVAPALTKKLIDAFKTSTLVTIELWIKNQKINSMFDYWFNALRSIKIVFLIIRSFRETNIDLLVASHELMVPLFFSLNHLHYPRWVSVFIQDLKPLPVTLPSLYNGFKKGNFVVNSAGNSFSKIAMYQPQEQNNRKIKSASGYINLVKQEDKELLEKIKLCWPEIHQYLESFDGRPVAQVHKEKTLSFFAAFNKDCIKVYENILMNPFSTNSQFCKINSSYTFPDFASWDSK